MTQINLPFGKVNILQNNIAEVIIDDSIVMDLQKLAIFHEALVSHFKNQQFSLLVNKTNTYTYEFEAQLQVGSLEQIDKTAIVAYSQNAKLSTQILMGIHSGKNWNAKMFSERQDAIEWLCVE